MSSTLAGERAFAQGIRAYSREVVDNTSRRIYDKSSVCIFCSAPRGPSPASHGIPQSFIVHRIPVSVHSIYLLVIIFHPSHALSLFVLMRQRR